MSLSWISAVIDLERKFSAPLDRERGMRRFSTEGEREGGAAWNYFASSEAGKRRGGSVAAGGEKLWNYRERI